MHDFVSDVLTSLWPVKLSRQMPSYIFFLQVELTSSYQGKQLR